VGAIGRKLSGESRRQEVAEANILAEQQRQFDITREDFAGTRELGNLAGESEAAFLGLRGADAERAAIEGFTESPGQVFLRERQERALVRNQAALGGLGGGNVRTALQEQAFGIAATQLGERKSRLAGVATRGAQATATGAAIGAGISGDITSTRLGFENARRAQSSADLQAGAGALTAFIGSDRRLKTNIRRIGTTPGGFKWYSFDYIWGEASEGVMSDEVPSDMVTQIGGFDFVDYMRIS
jgi:hypothetical protein